MFMPTIKLTQSKKAIVDDKDFDRVNQLKWTYAINRRDGHQFIYRKENGKNIYLHRFILDAPNGLEVDHINQNPLDNRRANLRLATRSQNAANIRGRSDNKSGFKGVSWDSERSKWYATITIDRKQKNLGRYESAIEAAQAYSRAAKDAFGEFAITYPLA